MVWTDQTHIQYGFLLSFPDISGLVATHSPRSHICKPLFSRFLLGSTSETGWENLAPQAATTEWRGEGTFVALVVHVRLYLCLPRACLPIPLCRCNVYHRDCPSSTINLRKKKYKGLQIIDTSSYTESCTPSVVIFM
jgi:hypothetical protein